MQEEDRETLREGDQRTRRDEVSVEASKDVRPGTESHGVGLYGDDEDVQRSQDGQAAPFIDDEKDVQPEVHEVVLTGDEHAHTDIPDESLDEFHHGDVVAIADDTKEPEADHEEVLPIPEKSPLRRTDSPKSVSEASGLRTPEVTTLPAAQVTSLDPRVQVTKTEEDDEFTITINYKLGKNRLPRSSGRRSRGRIAAVASSSYATSSNETSSRRPQASYPPRPPSVLSTTSWMDFSDDEK